MKPTVSRMVHWHRPEKQAEQKWTESGIQIEAGEWKEPVAAIVTKVLKGSYKDECRLQILDPWTRHNYSLTVPFSSEPKSEHWSWPAKV